MLALALGCTLAVAGCHGAAGVPDREPDVTGVIELSGTSSAPTLAEPSDLYFDQMSLLRGDPVLVDHAGAEVPYGDLADGDPIDVWIDGPCAESFPVQCTVTALRVHR